MSKQFKQRSTLSKQPLTFFVELQHCCLFRRGFTQQKKLSATGGTAAAACNAPDCLVSHSHAVHAPSLRIFKFLVMRMCSKSAQLRVWSSGSTCHVTMTQQQGVAGSVRCRRTGQLLTLFIIRQLYTMARKTELLVTLSHKGAVYFTR